MKKLLVLALVICCLSCQKETVADFTLNGTVKGLKKGTLYLQKFKDSVYVTLDSASLNGNSNFTLKSELSQPEVLFLKLDKNSKEENVIPFFANKGITQINTSLKNFNFDAEIIGSKQQKLLDEYLKVMNRYNNQNLDIIEASFLAQKNKDSVALDSLTKQSTKLIKKKYSYTIQFAINNNDSEIAPYLALYEIPDANPVFIDSIYKGLSENVKNSLYGIELNTFISELNEE
ncbi:DUF4369 domain-containing protein [Ichthyenterobacterium sp. W332]|uniref:DUF4369 domain-containing protein n=1 Tax=Microcosmobacter mediterraneus TaxID=3075607 RepID=A0ABU2YMB0_9FLAO|nr:DUF4369 domain-containing protein [Ichthyenterobacterium sp. W332]MDT0559295.1 DUF4369 domain-containing protein [Ichthyenterobacterium sp. W332]